MLLPLNCHMQTRFRRYFLSHFFLIFRTVSLLVWRKQRNKLMSEQLQEGRSWNYDFLRVICTIAVILIHVSSSYKNAYMDASAFGRLYTDNLLATCVYNVIPRFAVPCFVMLSGAFILADDRNANYYAFWNKKIRKIGIPNLIFSCGYTLWNMLTVLHGGG